jgi:hypothetical protein
MKQSTSKSALLFLLASVTAAVLALTYPATAAPPPNAELAATGQARTVISTLPYTISTPGTYILLGNLVSPSSTMTPAITIYASGDVVLNLKNFTITGGGIRVISNNATIENGTLINAGIAANPVPPGKLPGANYLTGLVVHKISFVNPSPTDSTYYPISFFMVNGATVSACHFTGGSEYYQIYDYFSSQGNDYGNLTFDGDPGTAILVETPSEHLFLSRAFFSPLTSAADEIKP